jgi:enoyl-CoA hydratase
VSYATLIYEPGAVTRIILNRPERRNAQSLRMLDEMDAAFRRFVEDPQAAIAVLSGAGPAFSAGHDLGSPEQVAERKRDASPESRAERSRRVYLEYTLRWRNLTKPTIAMVHGYLINGGWMIASAMDLIFAAESALFRAGHFQYFSIPWDLGARKTKEILWENRFMGAQEAYMLGLVNRVYPEADLERETLAYAARVASQGQGVVRRIKFSVNNALDNMGFTPSVVQAYQTAYAPDVLANTQRERPSGARRRLASVDDALERLRKEGPYRPRPYT